MDRCRPAVATPPGIDLDPILAALDPEQRAAAMLPDGPAQIIAPAGSGKTTTMVARLAVLLSRGVQPSRICVVTFNRDAAQDLAGRVAKRLGPSVPDATSIEVRTLHALARQVLLDAGEGSNILADRLPLLRAARRRHADDGSIGPAAGGVAARHVALGLEGRGSRAAGRCGGRSPDLRGAAAGARRRRLRRPRGPRRRPARDGSSAPPPLAVAIRARLRRRVPGRGRRPASPRPAACRSRGQPLRRRRRRPDDLRVAARRRATHPPLREGLPDRAARDARDELPMPGGGHRGLRADGRRQPRAIREADSGARWRSDTSPRRSRR